MGGFAENVMANGINLLVMPIFNIGYGLDPVKLGFALSIPRLLDALNDPILGWLSDNTRSKYGRRKPWLLASSILSMIIFGLIWSPGMEWSKDQIFGWFLVLSIVFFQMFGMYSINYNALGMELSNDPQERTSIQSFRYFFINLSTPFLGYAYWACQLEFFTGGDIPAGVDPAVIGAKTVGWIIAIGMFVFAMIPALMCNENPSLQEQEKIPLVKAFTSTMSNPVYLIFLAAFFVALLGVALVGPLQLYVMIYYIYGGLSGAKESAASLQGLSQTVNMIVSVCAIVYVTSMSKKMGKRGTMMSGMALSVVGSLTTWFTFTAEMPYLCLLNNIFITTAIGAYLMLSNAIIADICDWDELKTGLRREGMYTASLALLMKLAFSLITILSGYILKYSGFDQSLEVQTQDTVMNLRIIFMVVPAVSGVVALIIMLFFPLTKAQVAIIRAKINAKKSSTTDLTPREFISRQ